MFKTKMTRVLVLVLLGLALALGAVGAYAAVNDDSDESTNVQDSQQGDDDANDDNQDDESAQVWIGIVADPNAAQGGVRVVRVEPDGPADQAGIEEDDLITAVDGDEVANVEDIHDAIEGKAPGDTITLSVIKGGAEDVDAEDVTLTLGEQPDHGTFKDFGIGDLGPLADIFDGGFDKLLGGEFRYLDDDGNTVKIEVVPGTVTNVDDGAITIDVNGDEGERTFDVGDDVKIPERLANGDDAIVILKDDAPIAVLPGLGKLGIPGLPGFGPGFHFNGPEFNFNGPDSEDSQYSPLPDDFRDWFPDLQPQEESTGPQA